MTISYIVDYDKIDKPSPYFAPHCDEFNKMSQCVGLNIHQCRFMTKNKKNVINAVMFMTFFKNIMKNSS